MFTDRVKKVIQLARQESIRLGSDYVGTEHLLLGLLKEGQGVAIIALKSLSVDIEQLIQTIENSPSMSNPSGIMTISQMLPFTARAKKILEMSSEEANAMEHRYIGTEHLFLAFLKDTDSTTLTVLSSMGVTYENAKQEILNILQNSSKVGSINVQSPESNKKSKTVFLDHFGRDLTEMARNKMLDPIIGRTKEIERIIQILCRRKKNNPVLIGEPGVGKTAIVEGLAQRIIDKDIPEILEGKKVISLDMGSVVAGTKYRGQFEERIKTLIEELEANEDVIIFIDEIHTIVGAGGSEGSLDASNIFKPALARGEIQCVGATTLDEHRKHIEKDGALERRFQAIVVEPPSSEETLQIVRGLKIKYEDHHKVTYTEKSLQLAVELADRYITNRFQPDKSIDVIDEAGAQVRLGSLRMPPSLKDKEIKYEQILINKEEAVKKQDYELAATYRDQQDQIQEKLKTMKNKWRESQKKETLEVTELSVRQVVSDLTGVVLVNVNKEDDTRLLEMASFLKTKVIGQAHAIDSVSRALCRVKAGVHSRMRPMGCFLFLGSTGVGKTELAKQLADYLFGSKDSIIRVDMSEYMEKFATSRLIGAPPGYVGYEEGGQLTEKVRKKPYSLILFDEVEKAHPDVFNLLLQVMDEGHLTDSYGRKVNFKNTLIIMTSNLGMRDLKSKSMGFVEENDEDSFKQIKKVVGQEVKKTFNPEFINRLDEQIIFRPFQVDSMRLIVENLITELEDRLQDKQIQLELSSSALQLITEKGFEKTLGARPLRRTIQNMIEDVLAEDILQGKLNNSSLVKVSIRQKKLNFSYRKVKEKAES